MRFIKRNVWLLMLGLIFGQLLVLKADKPITFSTSELDEKQTHPIKFDINIYKADLLPIGQNYVTTRQIEQSHAELVGDFEFVFNLKSGFAVEEDKLKASLSCKLNDQVSFLDVGVKLVVPDLDGLEMKAQLSFRFGEELVQEFSNKSHDGIVYVIVMKSEQVNWVQDEENMRKEELASIEKSLEQLDLGQEFLDNSTTFQSKLAPIIANVSKAERLAYIEKCKVDRKVEYVLRGPRLAYYFPASFPKIEIFKDGEELVYDLSTWFGCDVKQGKQWVHYYSKSRKLVGNVDEFVDVKIREFVLNDNRYSMSLLRVSADLVMVGLKASETIEGLKLLEKQGKLKRLQSWSQFSNSSESQSIELNSNQSKVRLNCEQNWSGFVGMEVLFDDKENESGARLTLSSSFPVGKNIVVRCGVSFGEEQDKKCLLVMRVDKLDAYGRFSKEIPQTDSFLRYTQLKPIENSLYNSDPFSSDDVRDFKRYKASEDFINYLSGSRPNGPSYHLVTTPNHASFDAVDVVFDVKGLFLDNGLPMKKDDVVLFNKSKAELTYSINGPVESAFNELLEELKLRVIPEVYKTTVHFYEVDNRGQNESEWDLEMVMLSSPKRIGVVGMPGEVMIEQDGMILASENKPRWDEGEEHSTLDLKINYLGEKLSKQISVMRKLGVPQVIELKCGDKRSLVAMVILEEMR